MFDWFEYLIKSKTLIAIIGPTATGKTKLAIEMGLDLPVEIISADSRQIYRYLDIGTAKPDWKELKLIPHHFINIRNPDEHYSAGEFGSDAESTVHDIFNGGKMPLVVGGSGLYVKALCEGFFEENFTSEEKVRALQIRKELNLYSRESLYSKLYQVDPESAQLYQDKNYVRLVRALEFYYVKGIPISTYRRLYHRKPNFKTIYIGLTTSKNILYTNIEKRVDWMIQSGLVEEVYRILEMGFSPKLNSLNTVGYREIIEFFERKLSFKDSILRIKQNTKRYAKRQMTWFRKNPEIIWFDCSDYNIKNKVLNILNKFVFRST